MIKVNRIIKVLIASDIAYQIGAGFVAPVFAIFLLQSIENGSAQVAGTAAAIYLLVKSTLRLPIAYFLDKNRGERDDFYSIVSGFFILAIAFYLYLFAKTPVHIYLIQILTGVGGAFAFTPWYGFFSRHIDKHHESLEWGIEVSLVGFGMAGASYVAGFVAEKFGFEPVFIIAGTFTLLCTCLLLLLGSGLNAHKKDGYLKEAKK